MKAITIHQPWASLITNGFKRYETRGWRTNYRGPIAIHAGKKIDQDAVRMIQCDYPHIWKEIDSLPTGVVLAVAELVECRKVVVNHFYDLMELKGEKDAVLFDAMENDFGDFTPGRFAWELSNIRRLPEPIPARGQQGLWNWEPPDDWHCVICEISR